MDRTGGISIIGGGEEVTPGDKIDKGDGVGKSDLLGDGVCSGYQSRHVQLRESKRSTQG